MESRIGVVLPSVNTVVEPFFARAAPAGVSVHANRMLIGRAATVAAVEEMDAHGVEAAKVLATCRPGVIVYACTASGLVRGREHDLRFVRHLGDVTGVACVSATEAIVRALRAAGARRISIASPYIEELERLESAYFEACGFEVASGHALGVGDTDALADLTGAQIADLARASWRPSCDALLIACLNIRSHEVIDDLECELGKPVITATQAALWAALRLAGVKEFVTGYGRLLAGPVPA
jgi:maleate isomerase